MVSSACPKHSSPRDLEERGTFAATVQKEGCDHPVTVEIKLTGASKRWAGEIDRLSNGGQVQPDLLQTTAYNLNRRTAATLGEFLSDPDFERDTIVSILTATYEPEKFQEYLEEEKMRVKKPASKSKEIQIQNIPAIVEAMDSYYRQPKDERKLHHRTTRTHRVVALTERRESVVSDGAWLNITYLLNGRTMKTTSKNAHYGDSHYAWVGEQSRFLISSKASKEEVGKILTEAMNRLRDEARCGVEGADILLHYLEQDIQAVTDLGMRRNSPAPTLSSPKRSFGPGVMSLVSPSGSPRSSGGAESPILTGRASPLEPSVKMAAFHRNIPSDDEEEEEKAPTRPAIPRMPRPTLPARTMVQRQQKTAGHSKMPVV